MNFNEIQEQLNKIIGLATLIKSVSTVLHTDDNYGQYRCDNTGFWMHARSDKGVNNAIGVHLINDRRGIYIELNLNSMLKLVKIEDPNTNINVVLNMIDDLRNYEG